MTLLVFYKGTPWLHRRPIVKKWPNTVMDIVTLAVGSELSGVVYNDNKSYTAQDILPIEDSANLLHLGNVNT